MRCPNCSTTVPDSTVFCPECGMRLVANAPRTAADDTPQTVLQQRYVITQKLGQGGMGAVYRATDKRLSTVNWAVKELTDTALTTTEERLQARETFRHEAELLASLAHTNLPRVTDHFEESGKHYLVMEFVPGETMLAYVSRTGLPQPRERVFNWARQLCDVLDYLHSQKPPVIFRDLKPANIMITPQGSLKLIDFGIARLFKPGQSKDTQAFGTIGYSAPEQYGRGQTDARSDVYSLAVLLHLLLTGYDPTATPFRLPPANRVNPSVGPQLTAVLARATDNEPDNRFDSVHQFRDALLAADPDAQHAAVPPPPVVAAPPTPASQPFAGAQVQPQAFAVAPQVSQPMMQAVRPGSTGLAQTALWAGVLGVSSAAGSLLCSALARGSELGDDSAWYSLYIVLGLLSLAGMALALILGVIALLSQETAQTQLGRRHATIGLALGSIAIAGCCMAVTISPTDTNSRQAPPRVAQLIEASQRQIAT